MSQSDLDKFIKLLAQTDGRDKIYKVMQNAAKILAWVYEADKVRTKKYTTLQKSVSEGRSLIRMVKWVGNINKLQGIAAKGSDVSSKQLVEAFRVIGDFGYIFGDNVSYLSKYAILPFNAAEAARQSKIFQFWGYFFAVILDVWNIVTSKPKDEAEKRNLYLNLVKDTGDFLAVLSSVGYLKSFYHPSNGFTGVCQGLSGAIATYQNWIKIK